MWWKISCLLQTQSKGLFTQSESEKNHRTINKDQRISGKYQGKFSFSLSVSLDVNRPYKKIHLNCLIVLFHFFSVM